MKLYKIYFSDSSDPLIRKAVSEDEAREKGEAYKMQYGLDVTITGVKEFRI